MNDEGSRREIPRSMMQVSGFREQHARPCWSGWKEKALSVYKRVLCIKFVTAE